MNSRWKLRWVQPCSYCSSVGLHWRSSIFHPKDCNRLVNICQTNSCNEDLYVKSFEDVGRVNLQKQRLCRAFWENLFLGRPFLAPFPKSLLYIGNTERMLRHFITVYSSTLVKSVSPSSTPFGRYIITGTKEASSWMQMFFTLSYLCFCSAD